jgi:uncharacterized protein YodC (DUF2158 family)
MENQPSSTHAGAGTARALESVQIQPGDRVKLSSGGFVMTVRRIENGLAQCWWRHDKDGDMRAIDLPIEMLKVASPD